MRVLFLGKPGNRAYELSKSYLDGFESLGFKSAVNAEEATDIIECWVGDPIDAAVIDSDIAHKAMANMRGDPDSPFLGIVVMAGKVKFDLVLALKKGFEFAWLTCIRNLNPG